MKRKRIIKGYDLDVVLKILNNDIMKQELKNDLVASWNEAEELKTSLDELSDNELIDCRESLKERSKNILHWLSKYVSEEDIIE